MVVNLPEQYCDFMAFKKIIRQRRMIREELRENLHHLKVAIWHVSSLIIKSNWTPNKVSEFIISGSITAAITVFGCAIYGLMYIGVMES